MTTESATAPPETGASPFQTEEAAQDQPTQTYNPWKGAPLPHWYSGLGFAAISAPGTAVARGELALSDLAPFLGRDPQEELEHPEEATDEAGRQAAADAIKADAKMRLKALEPDPTTTSWAAQQLHTLGAGVTSAIIGSAFGGPAGAFAFTGGGVGAEEYESLRDQNVAPGAAGAVAAIRGLTAGAGVVTPMAFGSSLLTRLGTSIASNVGFGVTGRALDSEALQRAGYGAMADQERVFDRTQMLTDMVLGAGFGAFAHLHAQLQPHTEAIRDLVQNDSTLRDEALTANLALADRRSGPGIPVTPADANAHDAALRTALGQLEDGEHVNVAGSGVEDSTVLPRDGEPNPQVADLFERAMADSGILEETSRLEQLEQMLGRKLTGTEEPLPERLNPADLAKLPAETQPVLEAMYRQAAADKPAFDGAVQEIAATAGGDAQLAQLKGSQRAVEKVLTDYAGDPRQITDILRASIVARDTATLDGAHELVRQRFNVVTEKNRAANPGPDGYRDVMLKVRTDSGHVAEVQLHLPQMLAAKKVAHPLYVEREALTRAADGRQLTPAERARVDALNAQMRAIYDRAWAESTRSSQSSVAMPAPLRYSEDQGNVRGPSGLSNARQEAPPSGVGTSATGTPSTSQNFEPAGRVPEVRAGRGAAAGALPLRAIGSSSTESIPNTERVSTAAGRQIEVAHRIVELEHLITSDRPDFPAELQPRQRGERAALQQQVREIAANLVPERLGKSAEADRGAPIVSPGLEVESGNGRVQALREAYANHPGAAAAYRAFLESQGHNLAGFKQPALVRERVTPMTMGERQAFTLEANQAATASMSAVERGAADARRLDAGMLGQLVDGEIDSAANRNFVRDFLGGIPSGERAGLYNPDGSVNQEGVRRIQAAVLSKAYGGTAASSKVLGRMLESTDAEQRNLLGALLDAAPAFARLRQMVADGVIGPQFDITDKVLDAVAEAGKLRETGQSLEEHLGQADMLKPRDVQTDAILKSFYGEGGKRAASRGKIVEALSDYVTRAAAQRLDQGNLFGNVPLPPERLLEASLGERKGEAAPKVTDMFGLRTPQGKPTSPETGAPPNRGQPSAEDTAGRLAQQALADRPNLAIATEDGTVPATAAALQAKGEREQAEQSGSLFQAAADCFTRNAA